MLDGVAQGLATISLPLKSNPASSIFRRFFLDVRAGHDRA